MVVTHRSRPPCSWTGRVVAAVAAAAAGKDSDGLRKTYAFGVFPMFVPSLSWQMIMFVHYCDLHNNRSKTAETSAIRVS